jgi:hypothetical protein
MLLALLAVDVILGLAFNVYGVPRLSLFLIPSYFIQHVILRLTQSFASTLQAMTAFELEFFRAMATRRLWLQFWE